MDAHDTARDRRAWRLVLAASVALTLLAAWRVPRLTIDTDLVSLFPDAPAARDYREFAETFGGFERVYVLASCETPSEDRGARLADAVTDLAERLEASALFRSARAGPTDRDQRFVLEGVLPHAALLLDTVALDEALRRIEAAPVEQRVRDARAGLSGPLGGWTAAVFAADPLGFADGLANLAPGEDEIPIDSEHGVFLAPDGSTALVIADPAVAELDTDFGVVLEQELAAAFAAIRETHGDDIDLAALGGPLYAVRDARDIRADLVRTVFGSAVGITLLLAFYFRGARVPLVLLATVLGGVLWTAGGVTVVIDRVSVLGVAFASIVIGLGVDYGIHGAHAYRDERADGLAPFTAMRATLRRTGRSILASAATTASVFLLLRTSTFTPIRELGTLVAVGVVAIVLATVGIGAAVLVLGDRGARVGAAGSGGAPGDAFVRAVVSWVARHRRPVRVAIVALTIPAVWAATQVEFDVDLRAFRPQHRLEHAAEDVLASMFSIGVDPAQIVIRDADAARALTRAERMARVLRERLGPVARVRSPSDLIPDGRWEPSRRDRLMEVVTPARVDALERALEDHGFRAEAFERSVTVLRAIANGVEPAPILDELRPEWLRQSMQFDARGAAVALTVAASADAVPADRLAAMVAEIDPGARVASLGRVAAELRRAISREFLRMLVWGTGVIVVLVALTFRGSPRRTWLALMPVALGGVWLLGICGAFGIPLNFFTITAAPLLLGIGIDDGLHAIHGIVPHGGLIPSLSRVGGAIAITTWTTCVGFGSLGLSQLPALRVGGPLIALGTALCLAATVVALPAFAREGSAGP